MASDRGQNPYSDFVALKTLLRFENCSSSHCLLSSWRRFHVFESSRPSFHRTVFFGAPLAFLRGFAMGLCRRCVSVASFLCLRVVDCTTYLTAVLKSTFPAFARAQLTRSNSIGFYYSWVTSHDLSCGLRSVENLSDGVFHKLYKLILSPFVVCRTLSKNLKELEVKLLKERKEVVNVGG